MFGALKHRNFRLFFFGQSISLIGTWMQQVAMVWLVYRLSNSEFLLGLIGFCSQVPILFLAPVAGVFTDRWNRHRTIIATQSLAMLQAVILVVLTWTGLINVPYLIVLSIFMGLINAFDMPARQAFLIQMVQGRENLANAIGLNSSMFNGARLVGPAIAGVLVATAGESCCFLLNALSYVAVLGALLAMRITPQASTGTPQHVLRELRDGIRYAFGFPPIRVLLLLLALVSLAAMPLTVLMPVFATKVLGGGPRLLGALTAAIGIGALVGALLMAYRRTVLGLGRQIAWASGVFGLGLVAFSFSRSLWISFPILAVLGFAMMLAIAASNTVLQTIVDDDKRGRVMSFYTVALLGTAPLGSLLAGSLASYFGAITTVQVAGVVCVLGAVGFARQLPAIRELIRPIYRRIGILPDVTTAISPAVEYTVSEVK